MSETKKINLSIRSLCEFMLRSGSIDARFTGIDRGTEGARIHRKIQRESGSEYHAEVALRLDFELENWCFTLSGRADGVVQTENGTVVDEIKTTTLGWDSFEQHPPPSPSLLTERLCQHQPPPAFAAQWAQAYCYAYILSTQQQLDSVLVQLRYYQIETGEIRRYEQRCESEHLQVFMNALLKQYLPWAKLQLDKRIKRNNQLQKLNFPFPDYREGQRKLAVAVYQTCKNTGRLLCCAPTGIGKTVSTVFPALKAMGEQYGERIFYLTAKTITRTAVEQAVQLLRSSGASSLDALKSITLTAKDKICMQQHTNCYPEKCEWANGYFDRINPVLYRLLQQESLFSRENITKAAEQYRLCPYELALDLSEWCDLVICDYNYLFDPLVRLRRFFDNRSSATENIFLIDEAHNLLDRSRSMYSADLSKSEFYDFKKLLPQHHRRLHQALAALNKSFVALRKQLEQTGQQKLTLQEHPEQLTTPLFAFTAATELFLEQNRGSELEQEILSLYFKSLFYLEILDQYGDNYITLLNQFGNDIKVKMFCLDPAPYLNQSMDKGRSTILFSATLQPLRYYQQTLGCQNQAKLLDLPSPFPQHNLGLFVAGGVSTKYNNREATLDTVTSLLGQLAAGRTGNYIAYFPSYRYMQQAQQQFAAQFPGITILSQHPGMEEPEREEFLAAFQHNNSNTMMGFCVLGGIFSEAIDLVGDRLIGTAIVGVGLPQIGPEPDAIRQYWTQQEDDGFAYAYQFPGMNKVLQAAGRVIRGAEEAGVVLLIDNRFPSQRYQDLFPPHWNHWQQVDPKNFAEILQNHWRSKA